ncbi:unnamed protein product [Closterium sp. Naga37s-1]|nr:unnamed protein product [Closterium sp. Naga37s-1]
MLFFVLDPRIQTPMMWILAPPLGRNARPAHPSNGGPPRPNPPDGGFPHTIFTFLSLPTVFPPVPFLSPSPPSPHAQGATPGQRILATAGLLGPTPLMGVSPVPPGAAPGAGGPGPGGGPGAPASAQQQPADMQAQVALLAGQSNDATLLRLLQQRAAQGSLLTIVAVGFGLTGRRSPWRRAPWRISRGGALAEARGGLADLALLRGRQARKESLPRPLYPAPLPCHST